MNPDPLMLADWEKLRRDLLWARRGVIEEPYRRRAYEHGDRIVAWRLFKGRIDFRLTSGRFRVVAGQWIFPGTAGGERTFSTDAEFFSLRFHAHWPGGATLFDHALPVIPKGEAVRRLDTAAGQLIDFVQNEFTDRSLPLARAPARLDQHIALRALHDRWFATYVELMRDLGRSPAPPPPLDSRIEAAVRLMESRLRAGNAPTEAQTAREVGLSLSQFKRLFTSDLRCTPKQWMDRLRLGLADDLLPQSGRAVKQIAYELGFRSPNHFSAWFRRHRGGPPGGAARR